MVGTRGSIRYRMRGIHAQVVRRSRGRLRRGDGRGARGEAGSVKLAGPPCWRTRSTSTSTTRVPRRRAYQRLLGAMGEGDGDVLDDNAIIVTDSGCCMSDDSLFGDGCLGCTASETTCCLEMGFCCAQACYMAGVAAVPCDEEVPCMVGTRGSICYRTRGLHAQVARRDHGEGRRGCTPG